MAFSTKFFGIVRQQTFQWRSWYSPLRHKVCRYQNFSKTQNGSPTKYLVLWDNEFLNEDRDVPLCSKKNFRYQKIFKAQKAPSTSFFGTIKQQIFVGFGSVRRHLFYRETWYSPLRQKIFRYLKLSETQKCSPTKYFGTVRQKNFWQENVIRPPTLSPLLSKTFIETRNFVKHRSFPLRKISVLWDNKFPKEDRDILLVCIKFVDTRTFLKHRRLLLQSFLVLRDNKVSNEDRDIPSVIFPLRHKIFRYQKFSKTQNGSPTKYLVLWDNNFSNEDPDNPLWGKKDFRYQKISKAQKASSTKFFGTKRQQILESRSWYSPRRHQISRYQKIFETQKGSSTKFFGTMRQQILEKRSWYFPRRHKVFRYQKISETQKGSSTKCFGTVRQDNFDGKLWCPPPPLSLIFSMPETFLNTEGFLYKSLRYCETKKFGQKIVALAA